MGLENYQGKLWIQLESEELAQEIIIACRPVYELKHEPKNTGSVINLQGTDFPREDVSVLQRVTPLFVEVVDSFIKRTNFPRGTKNLYTLHLHLWQKEARHTKEKKHVRFEGYPHLRPSYVHISGVGEASPWAHDSDPSGRGFTSHRGIQIRFISQLHQRLEKSVEILLADSERLDQAFQFYTYYFG